MKRCFVVLFLILSSGMVMGREWVVDQAGNGDFQSIQSAVNDGRVLSGDIVTVNQGLYVGNISVPYWKELTIRSRDGFADTILMRPPHEAVNGPKIMIFLHGKTVFDGFTVIENPVNQFDDGDGFKLKDLPVSNGNPHNTAGITASGPAQVFRCKVSGFRFGILFECPSGAMGIPPVARFNQVTGNDIGITICETVTIIRDNIVSDNFWVGILAAHSACGEIANNLIVRNGDPLRGDSAGIFCWQSYPIQLEHNLEPVITGNTIDSNHSDGIRCVYELGALNQPVIMHNIISRNAGFGICCLLDTTDPAHQDRIPKPIVHRCDFYGNQAGATFQVARLSFCIFEDPRLTEDYHLSPDSPCINSGCLPGTYGTTSIDGSPDKKAIDLGFHHTPGLFH